MDPGRQTPSAGLAPAIGQVSQRASGSGARRDAVASVSNFSDATTAVVAYSVWVDVPQHCSKVLAERVGFEPTDGLTQRRFFKSEINALGPGLTTENP